MGLFALILYLAVFSVSQQSYGCFPKHAGCCEAHLIHLGMSSLKKHGLETAANLNPCSQLSSCEVILELWMHTALILTVKMYSLAPGQNGLNAALKTALPRCGGAMSSLQGYFRLMHTNKELRCFLLYIFPR